AHVSTQAGNVLACAAGNYVLERVSDEQFLASVRERGDYFVNGLRSLQDKHTLIGRIDSQGLYIGVELVRDRNTKEPAPDEAERVLEESLREGIVFEKGGFFHNRLQLIPPLTIEYETIDDALEKFDRIFTRVEQEAGQ